MPPEAQEISGAGALAFLAWWVDMYNYVEATGETDLVFQYSEPGCTFCQSFVDRVQPVYLAGGWITRSSPTILSDIALDDFNAERPAAVVVAALTEGAGTTLDASGSVTGSAPAGTVPVPVSIGLVVNSGEWRMFDIARGDQ